VHYVEIQIRVPVKLALDLLNAKPISFDTVLSTTTTVPSFESFRSGVFVYRANIHTHIVTK